ncbi:MAG: ABC transporter ATP-binding protein [candidate division Zixibacteria bacterium]|nr:ABC transporter ATP-binding protein [candidate division Zixibacteria bacterium]
MSIVDVQDLTKIYRTGMRKGDIVALDNVNLSIKQGEIFGLLGPNGAGKTTLFKCLLGITQLTSGSITISDLPPSDPHSRQKIGYLPENHRFPDYLTGLGLLELTGRMHGMSQSEIDSCTDELLELVDMTKWTNTKLAKYSKGMSQRIGLAQALVCDPEILLLDEPTDGVDPVGKIDIREILKRIRTEGKSIVINTHLLSEVESIVDRVAILSKGRVLKVSSVEMLTSRQSQYEIVAEMHNRLIELPPDIGKVVAVTAQGLLVELTTMKNINYVIDQLRYKQIEIRSVKPLKISLEQSFLETISGEQEDTA